MICLGKEQTDFEGLSANEIDKFFDYGDEQDPGRDAKVHMQKEKLYEL